MANNIVTMKSAAFSKQQKMATLTQQCFSEEICETLKISILNEFMQDLYESGYSEWDRKQILEGGINTFKNIKQLEYLNIRPFYRPNSFNKSERRMAKFKKKNCWYKSDSVDVKYRSVMFVDATPGDRLASMIRETEEKYKISDSQRIKIVSKAGTKLAHLVETKDPFEKNCATNDCPPCDNSDPNQLSRCKRNNICYEAKCKTCDQRGKNRTYTGETYRNMHIRSKEHVRGLENGDPNNWMVKHVNKEHEGNTDEAEFTWKVIKKHRKLIQRQLQEAVRIQNKTY